MNFNIRYPNITALHEKEQLAQIKSYLHQLVDQLNHTNLGAGSGSQQTASVQGSEVSYYELRSMIIQQIQRLDDMFGELADEFVKDTELNKAVAEALRLAKENGDLFTEEDIASVAVKAANKIQFTLDAETGILYYEVVENEDSNDEAEEQ